ncbi:mechanosensitive ion channel family protein [Solilutibacter silvestris]|uniref:Mechanosensitive ion channel n=1 Tax=Solilutibacter silvestris TaxID=1645665 RepID=A0A2K1Q1T6_9GAMM|nr:mechanosensitive ion channel domain-containing protein [Lysobacter silvestris]PNS08994.1 Mechanosensitive ion channel [Lysobacter silvestris]
MPEAPPLRDRLHDTGDRVREAAGDAASRSWTDLQPIFDYRLVHAGGFDITVGGLVGALLALLIGLTLSRFLQRWLYRFGEQQHGVSERATIYTLSRVVHYVLLITAFLVALNMLGIPLGKFTVFAGALGVGLGFGLQAIFSNFISGLILLFDRSLKVGDFVELDKDVRGTVRAVNIRATRVTTNDNIDVLVPNSEFINKRVVNWTHGSVNRRIRVPFSVSYGVDKELVKKAALEAAANVPFTLANEGPQAPQVWLVDFGESAVQFVLAVWLTEDAARRNAAIRAAYLWELDSALKKHGIERPFPQRDLNLRSLFGLQGTDAIRALRGETIAPVVDGGPGDDLQPVEREALARNDAQADAERGIREDQMRAVRESMTRTTLRKPGSKENHDGRD